jgi:SAM-dependent methyltransferase
LGSPWQTLPDFLYRQRRNFKASSTFWLEITYSVEGAQIFYTRTFLQHEGYSGEIADLEKELDEIIAEGKGEYKSGDDLLDLPRLADTFDKWLEKLQPDGHVLDAGCGHGDPVLARLLAHGFEVTGSDFSPNMLQRAARQFPRQASFKPRSTNCPRKLVMTVSALSTRCLP